MAKPNAYLAARDADRQKFFTAGCETAAQQMFDMLTLALSDPDVVGDKVLSEDEIWAVHQSMYDREAFFHPAWTNTQESDWYQEKLDKEIKDVCPKRFAPFRERYPYTKDWDYNKVMKK